MRIRREMMRRDASSPGNCPAARFRNQAGQPAI
jgi:hypothetical protein